MIDVSEYIEQLEQLRIRLLARIDGFWIDMDMIPRGFTATKIIQLFYEQGVIFYSANEFNNLRMTQV